MVLSIEGKLEVRRRGVQVELRPDFDFGIIRGQTDATTHALNIEVFGLPKKAAFLMKESKHAICERVAEIQALLDDHVAGAKHSPVDVVAKAQADRSEPERLRGNVRSRLLPP